MLCFNFFLGYQVKINGYNGCRCSINHFYWIGFINNGKSEPLFHVSKHSISNWHCTPRAEWVNETTTLSRFSVPPKTKRITHSQTQRKGPMNEPLSGRPSSAQCRQIKNPSSQQKLQHHHHLWLGPTHRHTHSPRLMIAYVLKFSRRGGTKT